MSYYVGKPQHYISFLLPGKRYADPNGYYVHSGLHLNDNV